MSLLPTRRRGRPATAPTYEIGPGIEYRLHCTACGKNGIRKNPNGTHYCFAVDSKQYAWKGRYMKFDVIERIKTPEGKGRR